MFMLDEKVLYLNLLVGQWCPKQIGASSMIGFVVEIDKKNRNQLWTLECV